MSDAHEADYKLSSRKHEGIESFNHLMRTGRASMTIRPKPHWETRYRRALRNSNIAFAIAAFLLPFLLIGFIFILEKSGVCLPAGPEEAYGSCKLLGYEFGEQLSEVLVPTALGIVTLGCLLMSGVGTFFYLLWRMKDK